MLQGILTLQTDCQNRSGKCRTLAIQPDRICVLKGPIRHEHRGNISCTLYSQWHIAEEDGVQNRLKEIVAVASHWILEVNTNHFITKPMQQLRSIQMLILY